MALSGARNRELTLPAPPLSIEDIAQRITIARGRRVLLDADLAAFYGESTKRFNEQIKRNLARFPADFMFQLGEEPDTIEDVLEPYLIQQGYLQRTPRGRIATPLTYRHLGLVAPSGDPGADLF